MAGRLNVEPQAVSAFARKLSNHGKELEGTVSRIRSGLNSLHTAWKDDKYRQFSAEMQEVEKQIKKARERIEIYSKHLHKYASEAARTHAIKI
jgi:WXG100 family type VII secretion target